MVQSAREAVRNNVKEKLARGEVVASMIVRLVRSAEIAGIAKTAGFDTFYLDMTTPDPNLVFSAGALYRRSEGRWGVILMAAFLLQLALLRPFYRRLAFVLRTRLAGARRA